MDGDSSDAGNDELTCVRYRQGKSVRFDVGCPSRLLCGLLRLGSYVQLQMLLLLLLNALLTTPVHCSRTCFVYTSSWTWHDGVKGDKQDSRKSLVGGVLLVVGRSRLTGVASASRVVADRCLIACQSVPRDLPVQSVPDVLLCIRHLPFQTSEVTWHSDIWRRGD